VAKQGQHKADRNDPRVSKGPNKPAKSVTVTTGSPKKQETYRRQAAEGKSTDRPAQAARNVWDEDTRPETADEKRRLSRERGGGKNQ
jgi:hypothetical protein